MDLLGGWRTVRASLALATVLLIAVSGCARWVPARVGEVPIGTDVRLRLSEEGTARLEELTGTRWAEISGRLLQWDSEVMVSAALRSAGVGANGNGLRQRLVVEEEDVVGVDVRELDRTRTGFFVGGVALAAGAAIAWAVVELVRGSGGASRGPPANVPSEPLVRLRIP